MHSRKNRHLNNKESSLDSRVKLLLPSQIYVTRHLFLDTRRPVQNIGSPSPVGISFSSRRINKSLQKFFSFCFLSYSYFLFFDFFLNFYCFLFIYFQVRKLAQSVISFECGRATARYSSETPIKMPL